MKRVIYILLCFVTLTFFSSCENDVLDDLRTRDDLNEVELPALTAGSADFSNYVALGASFTAGFTDNGLFIASQEASFPSTIASKFALAGGGDFVQPLMNDNFGGLALAGNRLTNPRLVFGGAGPVPLETVLGPVTVTTDIATNNPTGPFNNLGIPGAKSFHLVANGYGNIDNLPNANPYAVRVTGDNPNASILELAVAQNPSFFTLSEIGGNDVLGYATSGGNGTNPLTEPAVFDAALGALVAGLTSNGAQGAIANLPNITSLPFFTTVPHAPLDPTDENFGPLIPTLNTLYGALNQVYAFLGVQGRNIVFSETSANPIVIQDENLTDLSAQITQVLLGNPAFPDFLAQFGLPPQAAPQVAGLFGQFYGQARQATEDDLVLLTAASVIGEVDQDTLTFLVANGLPQALAAQFAANGVTLPLGDTFVLLPEEQQDIADATSAYNSTIESIAQSNGLALVDLNSILVAASTTGVPFDNYFLNTNLVFGGLVSLDGIHLTARGYALMANAFLDAIDQTYGSNFRASGNVARAGDYPTNFPPNL
jgi:hypothetical protein